MNFYTTNPTVSGRQRHKAQISTGVILNLEILTFLVFVGIIIFVLMNIKVHLKSKIEKLTKESSKIEARINDLRKEREILLIKKESLTSWKAISMRIKKFSLPLRLPKPYQVRYLDLNSQYEVNNTKTAFKKVKISSLSYKEEG